MRDELIRIVEQASTLYERLSEEFIPVRPQTRSEIDRRLQTWAEAVARGDRALFEERLRLDGMNLDRARLILGPVRIVNPEKLPNWVYTLEESIERMNHVSFCSPENIPFEEVLWSLVLLAMQKMDVCLFRPLLDSAVVDLQMGLLKSLSTLCSPVFVLEMNLASICKELKDPAPEDRYHEFLRNRLGDSNSLLSMFKEYPVLGRLLAIRIDQWVQSTSEFLQHLLSDQSGIAERLGDGSKPGSVVHIKDGLSDPHNEGRCVKMLQFESGIKIIYKPRSIDLEAQFLSILRTINETANLLQQHAYRVWSCENHGWAEFVEARPCKQEDEFRRYHERAGMLLCLCYKLGITDCHWENTIAHGEYPVLIDIEILFTAKEEGSVAITAQKIAADRCLRSVLRTAFLTHWIFGEPGRQALDIGGFTASGQPSPYQHTYWIDPKTDRMRLTKYFPQRSTNSSPTAENSAVVLFENYGGQFLTGFKRMYEFLLQNETEQIAEFKPLHVRRICRGTIEYHFALQNSLDPSYLTNGIDRSIQIDRLSTRAVTDPDGDYCVLRAEEEAIEKMNIPFFTNWKEPITTRLSDNDRKEQIAIIEASMMTRATAPTVSSESYIEGEPITEKEVLQEAVSIAEDLKQMAIYGLDGSATWITLAYLDDFDQHRLQPVNAGLYDGCCGIALFLAGLQSHLPRNGYGELALAALKTLRKELSEENDPKYGCFQNGIDGGIAGICYAFLKVGLLLEREDLIQEAKKAAKRIQAGLIQTDRRFDFMGGAAGTLLGLLSLYNFFGERNLLDQAILCGDHLLAHRFTSSTGHRVWKSLSEKPLTGFSHGAAGIGYALLQVYQASENREFLEAALEAFDYEASVFDRNQKNWPDFRTDPTSFQSGWCHGAPGIALSRMAGLSVFDSDQTRNDVTNGLQTTKNLLFQNRDDLCCGNSGRIETLLYAARLFSSSHMKREATSAITHMIRKKQTENGFQLLNNSKNRIYNTGLFKGTSGIGLTLLRVLDERRMLPFPLLLQ